MGEQPTAATALSRPLPLPDDLTRPYWQAAAEGVLVVQRCQACGALRCPPSATCDRCPASAHEWVRMSGVGTIYSYCVAYDTLVRGFTPPYVVALVELPEQPGLRITTNIVECEPDAVTIGMPVAVTFEPVGEDIWLPQFRPAAAP